MSKCVFTNNSSFCGERVCHDCMHKSRTFPNSKIKIG